ncbi:MAG TPA: hypothetical protein VLV46_07485 [Gaiellaceae bacterium]|nr:hypothetical protein [Gaiellaceae bacterium]
MAATNAPATRQQPSAWHSWVPWVLVVLAAVIALVSALNIWVKRQALDTNNFTNASVRLLEDPQVRSAISVYLVDQLYQNVNVTAELQKELPPQIQGIAAPLAGALRQLLVRAADTLLSRPRVQELWKQAVMNAHKLFIAVLDGKRQILQNTNGNVVLNLRPIVQELEQQGGLVSKIASQLPADAGQITIMKGNQLHAARTAVKAVRFLSYFLFFLVIAIYALAVYLATGRRRTVLMGVGVSGIVIGLIVLVIRRFAGNYLIDALTSNPIQKPAVSVVWAVETELLRNVGINILIYGFFVILAAWIAGPSRPARWVRRVLTPTARDHPWIIYGAVALVLLLILFTGPTDGQRVYPLLVVFALAFVGVEVLRRQMLREFPAAQPGT